MEPGKGKTDFLNVLMNKLELQSKNKQKLISIILDNISDESQLKDDYYQGRVHAFRLVLDLLEELEENS